MTSHIPARVAGHVAAFNAAVESGDWAGFAERFAPGAVMRFSGVPAGPFTGRDAIARAYAGQPPADTMTVRAVESAGPEDTVRFGWTRGGTGVMRLTWQGGLITSLDVTFGSG
jgi:steroid Delta-isomerase